MTVFWIGALIMGLLAAGFVVWPLRGSRTAENTAAAQARELLVLDLFNEHKHQLEAQLQAGEIEQSEFEQLLSELQLSLLQDAGEEVAAAGGSSAGSPRRFSLWLPLCALLVPLTAIGFYWFQGSYQDLRILESRNRYFLERQSAQTDAQSQEALDRLISQLQQRLEQRPDNDGNRYLLARAHMQQGDYAAAVRSYSQLLQGEEPPAYILAELAQALFLVSGNRITAEVDALSRRALELDPHESTALGLVGISAFEKGDYTSAITVWERAVQLIGASSAAGRSLLGGIQRAREMLAQNGEEALSQPATADSAGSSAVTVAVSLDQSVDAAPSATVFVYARAWQGPKMPLAIARLRVADLPTQIRLDESMAMAPGMSISSVSELELVARVSSSGSVTPASGDWQATRGPLVLEELQQPVELVIAQQVP